MWGRRFQRELQAPAQRPLSAPLPISYCNLFNRTMPTPSHSCASVFALKSDNAPRFDLTLGFRQLAACICPLTDVQYLAASCASFQSLHLHKLARSVSWLCFQRLLACRTLPTSSLISPTITASRSSPCPCQFTTLATKFSLRAAARSLWAIVATE